MVNIFSLIIYAACLIVAITIHEFSHALTADRLGDPTPRSFGRLTLNPLKHLDLIGTIMIFLVHFGWGKPVPIDTYNLKNPKRDEMLISLSGPASNLILAALLSLIIRFVPLNLLATFIISTAIQFNILLAVFNLIPIPPLDGSKILLNLLPTSVSEQWQEAFNQYGFILLIVFLFLPISNGATLVNLIVTPVMGFITKFLLG
jgi:Zn-dependent protease